VFPAVKSFLISHRRLRGLVGPALPCPASGRFRACPVCVLPGIWEFRGNHGRSTLSAACGARLRVAKRLACPVQSIGIPLRSSRATDKIAGRCPSRIRVRDCLPSDDPGFTSTPSRGEGLRDGRPQRNGCARAGQPFTVKGIDRDRPDSRGSMSRVAALDRPGGFPTVFMSSIVSCSRSPNLVRLEIRDLSGVSFRSTASSARRNRRNASSRREVRRADVSVLAADLDPARAGSWHCDAGYALCNAWSQYGEKGAKTAVRRARQRFEIS
jgi:hypothetical protein